MKWRLLTIRQWSRSEVWTLVGNIKKWVWGKTQQTIWQSSAARDQLGQIIWRLEMNEKSCPPDTKAALVLARRLRDSLDA